MTPRSRISEIGVITELLASKTRFKVVDVRPDF